MRFFIPGLPHAVTSPEYCACAFSTKVLRMCKMLKDRGHYVIHLGHERSEVECDEHVTVTRDKDLQAAYGDHDWRRLGFKFDTGDSCYREFFGNAIGEIWKRKQPKDILLSFWGAGHKPLGDAHPDLIAIEGGIGYAGGFWAPYKIFESYALLHAYLGLSAVGEAGKCENYSVVIPNYFSLADFTFSEEKDDYFLAIGRIGTGKGVHIAIQACEAIGARLLIAGQGGPADAGYTEWPAGVEYVGFADVDKRRQLLARAKGVFVLSQYVEPFGGVMIEAALSGTPVITSDWGAATENVLHGITGYRCRTFEHITWAARNIDRISPRACRDWAASNFSTDRVADMYEEFFRMVMDIHTGKGWYEPHDDRTDLDWLTRQYPGQMHPGMSVAIGSDVPATPYTGISVLSGEPNYPLQQFDLRNVLTGPIFACVTDGCIERSDLGGNVPGGDPCSWSPALWARLIAQFDIKSVLDVGCGEGHAVKWFRDAGIRALGFDGLQENVQNAVTSIHRIDLTHNSLLHSVDLVWCCEVVEHIHEAYLNKLLETLCNGRIIAMTHALPGQVGHHHVNCQPPEYWIRHITARGYEALDPEPFRKIAREENERSWFARSGLVFRRIP